MVKIYVSFYSNFFVYERVVEAVMEIENTHRTKRAKFEALTKTSMKLSKVMEEMMITMAT